MTLRPSRSMRVVDSNEDFITNNNNIVDQVNRSAEIQKVMLPDISDFDNYFKDIFLLFRPLSKLSGDFYWVSKDREAFLIVLGDSTGHGVPGALLSIMAFTTLYNLNASHNSMEPAQINSALNEMLHCNFNQNPNRINMYDGFDLATIRIEKSKKLISFSGAKRPLIIVRDNELIEVKGDRRSTGLFTPKNYKFKEHKFRFKAGDKFYVFTDGFQDQFGGEDDKRLTYRRLKKMILEVHQYPMNQQNHYFNSELLSWKKFFPYTDDISLMGFQVL